MFGKRVYSCFLLTAMTACSGVTEYNTGAVVLDISHPEALNSNLETTPEFISAYDSIKGQNYLEAEALLEVALERKPKDPYALLAMGSIHEKTGRYSTAADLYKQAEHYGYAAAGPQWAGVTEIKENPSLTVSEVARENLEKLRQQAIIVQ